MTVHSEVSFAKKQRRRSPGPSLFCRRHNGETVGRVRTSSHRVRCARQLPQLYCLTLTERSAEIAIDLIAEYVGQGATVKRRVRNPPATDPSSGDDVDRPALPRGGQPAPTARTLAILSRRIRRRVDAQQLREAFPWEKAPRYLIHDRDHAFERLETTAKAMGIEEVLNRDDQGCSLR